MVGYWGSSAGSYLTDPTSPMPSHYAVIILFKSVPVHQLSWLALQELIVSDCLLQRRQEVWGEEGAAVLRNSSHNRHSRIVRMLKPCSPDWAMWKKINISSPPSTSGQPLSTSLPCSRSSVSVSSLCHLFCYPPTVYILWCRVGTIN